jgi:hypothetical protein
MMPRDVTMMPRDVTMMPRDVTMMPRDVSVPPDTTLPVVTGLPTAPPVETTDDLRSWLGSEEAFFNTTPRRTGDVVVPRRAGLSPMMMLAILVAGIALGALVTLKGC